MAMLNNQMVVEKKHGIGTKILRILRNLFIEPQISLGDE